MKHKIILTLTTALLLFGLVWCLSCLAQEQHAGLSKAWQGMASVQPVQATAAACSTSTDSAIEDRVTTGTTSSSTAYFASKFTLAADSTITEYVWRGCDNNTDTGNHNVAIYTHNAGDDKPGSAVADTTATVAASAIANCDTWENTVFTLASTKALSAGTYWMVRWGSASATHKLVYHSSTGARYCSAADGSTWSCAANVTLDWGLYGCVP